MMDQNIRCYMLLVFLSITGLVKGNSFIGNYGDVTIECSMKNITLEVGTTFRIKCSTSGDVKDLLIGKTDTYGDINLDTRTHESKERRADNLPSAVYNDSSLEEKLEELAPGRYKIEDHEGGKTVVVTDAQPEDGGDWVCGTMGWTANNYKDAPICNVLVVGPVKNLTFYMVDTFQPIADGGIVVVEHDTKVVNIGLNLTIANVYHHDLPVYAGSRSVSSLFLKDGNSGISTTYDAGLTTHSRHISFKAKIPINGLYKNQVFKAKTYIKDFYEPVETNFTLAVKGPPYGVVCSTVSMDESTKEGTLKCEAVVFPKGEVMWHTPRVANVSVGDESVVVKNSTFANTIDGIKMSSMITIQHFGDEDYSDYKVVFVNEFGSVTDTNVVSGGPVAKPLIPLMYLMVLLVAAWSYGS